MTSDAGGLTGDEDADLQAGAGGGTGDGEREVSGVTECWSPLGGELGRGTCDGVLVPTIGTRAGVELSAGTREKVGGMGD